MTTEYPPVPPVRAAVSRVERAIRASAADVVKAEETLWADRVVIPDYAGDIVRPSEEAPSAPPPPSPSPGWPRPSPAPAPARGATWTTGLSVGCLVGTGLSMAVLLLIAVLAVEAKSTGGPSGGPASVGPLPIWVLGLLLLVLLSWPLVLLWRLGARLIRSLNSGRRHDTPDVGRRGHIGIGDSGVSRALALDHEAVFRKARGRIDLAFKVQLAILVLLALVLVAGLGGAILASLAGQLGLAAGSGGASVLGLIASIILKPNAEIGRALQDAQRLDLIHEGCRSQLDLCRHMRVLQDRIDCASKVWEKSLNQLKGTT